MTVTLTAFQTMVRFMRHWISQESITPIDMAIQFADMFPNQILDKNSITRFLGCLNYVADFDSSYQQLYKASTSKAQTDPPPSTDVHSNIIKQIKLQVKHLPCLRIPNPPTFKIVQNDPPAMSMVVFLIRKLKIQKQVSLLLLSINILLNKTILQSRKKFWQPLYVYPNFNLIH